MATPPNAAEVNPSVLAGHLDQPQDGAKFSAWLTVSGWALSTGGESVRIRIHADGAVLREIETGCARPDVATHYPDVRGAGMAGFHTVIRRSSLPERAVVTIAVEAVRAHSDDFLPLGEVTVHCVEPALTAPARANYHQVWESVSATRDEAVIAVCGFLDEAEYVQSGEVTTGGIMQLTSMKPTDSVLEIGCGTGRIGAHMAKRCALWTGADVSSNMLRHASEALAGLPNVRFQQIDGYDLAPFAVASFDVVYCSAVFMHLDEWDRFRYVTEMFRVLKPGGRCYYDNFNLLGDSGWEFFLSNASHEPVARPLNISKSSTPQELECYARRAGFADIFVGPNVHWIQLAARKP